jgi:hypothetical protein
MAMTSDGESKVKQIVDKMNAQRIFEFLCRVEMRYDESG